MMSISGVYGYCKGPPSGPSISQSSIVYPASESTVLIRRQKEISQEIKPPVDPIYGTRQLTSFTDTQLDINKRKITSDNLLAHQQNTFNSSQSTSSGYHSANASNSSASNSTSNSPIPPSSSLTNNTFNGETNQGNNIYSTLRHNNTRNSQNNSSMYGRTTMNSSLSNSGKIPQAPQIPLPPIPQMNPMSMHPSQNQFSSQKLQVRNTDYGRTNGPLPGLHGHLGSARNIYGQTRASTVARSSSLRVAATGGLNKQYTNTLPHVLLRDSHYNTNV